MASSDTATAPAQRWLADRYAANARYVADLAEPLIDLLAPRAGELVLDLGCGDGALTEKVAARGARVIGVDASFDQVRAAADRNLVGAVMDGEGLAFTAAFDAILSNAALHWMRRAEAAIDGMWRALKPGGRVVAELGGAGNIAAIASALNAAVERRGYAGRVSIPWYFPAPDEYRGLLEARGFLVSSIVLIPRPTPLPGDIADWLETFAESYILALPANERTGFIAEVREALRPVLYDAEGRWVADYVRLRVCATKHV